MHKALIKAALWPFSSLTGVLKKKNLFISLKVSDRESQGKIFHSLVHTQMSAKVRTGPGWNSKLHPSLPHDWPEPKDLGCALLLSQLVWKHGSYQTMNRAPWWGDCPKQGSPAGPDLCPCCHTTHQSPDRCPGIAGSAQCSSPLPSFLTWGAAGPVMSVSCPCV